MSIKSNGSMSANPLPMVVIDGSIIDATDYCQENTGLTKRERFAMAAMQGLCVHVNDPEKVGVVALAYADSLLRELAK